MRKLLTVANEYPDEFNIIFNATKSQLMPFGNASRDSRLAIGDTVIPCNLFGIHLGHWLGMLHTENGIRKVYSS